MAERPEKFTKLVTAAEKKLLEDLLERSLGVTRKTPQKRAPAKRAATPRKTAAVKKRAPAKEPPF